MFSARVAITFAVVAVLSVMGVNAAPAAAAPEALAAGDIPPGYLFCTSRPDYKTCYNLCGAPYWFEKPDKCCCK
ncbi:hypothetical protein BGX34_003801 [Mortierella sp. NVP85]|nr:hypothetical protein BGX34_003801 [Mortierella sp. NVP85]